MSVPVNPIVTEAPKFADVKASSREERRWRRFKPMQRRLAVGLGMIWALLLVAAQLGGAFEELEQPSLDWRQALPAPTADNNLALVAIDDIPQDRPWPWARLDYALFMRSLLPYAPQSVVFEMQMQNPDPFYSAFDSAFGDIVNRYDHVIFSAAAMTSSTPQPAPANMEKLKAIAMGQPRAIYSSVHGPIADFIGQSYLGVSNLTPMTNQSVPRRIPLVFQVKNMIVPAIALEAASQFVGANLAISEVVFGDAIYLRTSDGKVVRRIPIDDEGRMQIRYRRVAPPLWRISFDNVVLYAEQALNGEKQAQDLTQLRHRQVWVGRVDKALAMKGISGVTPPLCPVEVHMIAARDIITGDFVRHVPGMLLIIIYLAVGGIGAALLLDYSWPMRLAYTAVTIAIWWAMALLVFQVGSLFLPMVSFALVALGWLPVSRSAERWDLEANDDQLPLDLG